MFVTIHNSRRADQVAFITTPCCRVFNMDWNLRSPLSALAAEFHACKPGHPQGKSCNGCESYCKLSWFGNSSSARLTFRWNKVKFTWPLVSAKHLRVIRSDHNRQIRTIGQHQRLENSPCMVHVAVIGKCQYRRALHLSIHQHLDRCRSCAIVVHVERSRNILYARTSRHTASLAANESTPWSCTEMTYGCDGHGPIRGKNGSGVGIRPSSSGGRS